MKKIFNCKWAVAHKIDKGTQDDRKTKVRVVAMFSTPCNAEDFINNCLPKETKEIFFIIDIIQIIRLEIRFKILYYLESHYKFPK